MALADFVIVGVVSGGDLDGTRSELHVDDDRVGNDGDLATGDEGVDHVLAVEMLVPRVVWVNSNGGITEHGLGTSGGDDDLLITALDLIREADDDTELDALVGRVAGNVHEGAAVELLLVDLEVGKGCVKLAAPIDEAVGSVDDAVLVQLAESFGDSLGAGSVHGEGLSGKVVRGTETTHLVGDPGLVVVLPLKDLLEELFTAIVVARLALCLCKTLLDDALGGDTGVIVARVEEGPVAVHAVPSDQSVLNRDGEGVTDVEGAGDVGRGCRNDEGLFGVVGVRF